MTTVPLATAMWSDSGWDFAATLLVFREEHISQEQIIWGDGGTKNLTKNVKLSVNSESATVIFLQTPKTKSRA